MEYINNGSFICDRCREICMGGCHEDLMDVINGKLKEGDERYPSDLIGRKHIIHCLGKYCDKPCKLQREDYTPFNESDGLQPLFNAIKYMGQRLNDLLVNDKK